MRRRSIVPSRATVYSQEKSGGAIIMTASPATHSASARFFFIMACIMGTVSIGGFALMAFMGVSSFARPWFYHAHAAVFISWTLLYVAQNSLILMGNIPLHRRMGLGATVLIPLLVVRDWPDRHVVAGRWVAFFRQGEFPVVNILHIGALRCSRFVALRRRRDTDWHRRLMFGAWPRSGPGTGPAAASADDNSYTFYVVFLAAMIFPIIGMIADSRIRGSVHSAWRWTLIISGRRSGWKALSTLPAIENGPRIGWRAHRESDPPDHSCPLGCDQPR